MAGKNQCIDIDPSAGSGRIQFFRLTRGITMTILNCNLLRPVPLQYDPPFETLGIGFNLAGQMEVRPGRRPVLNYKPGQTDLNTNPGDVRLNETLGPGHMMRVCLSMNHEVLEELTPPEWLPEPLQKKSSDPAHYRGRITPSMRSVIAQIIKCPFQGSTRHLYLESKALELLVHKLEELKGAMLRPSSTVKAQDLDRVQHAADLLTANLETAPSLGELARGVGMCRTRLHECFCQVHGVTPFEYLQRFRLETAMNYLVEGRMNVTEAALAVGYGSSGYFSKVFKKQYGDPPKKYVSHAPLGDSRTILPEKRKIVHA